ncbi:hypothetical protein V8C42DRAFT_6435 [Trichoderma barbatum]
MRNPSDTLELSSAALLFSAEALPDPPPSPATLQLRCTRKSLNIRHQAARKPDPPCPVPCGSLYRYMPSPALLPEPRAPLPLLCFQSKIDASSAGKIIPCLVTNFLIGQRQHHLVCRVPRPLI